MASLMVILEPVSCVVCADVLKCLLNRPEVSLDIIKNNELIYKNTDINICDEFVDIKK